MNPISRTILSLAIWTILAIVIMYTTSGDMPFIIMIYSIYLMPIVCIIAFGVSVLFQRKWLNENLKVSAIFSLILAIWLLLTFLYIKSLFI